ncbi:DNA polymerase III subunit delta [Bifidobacterium jacchi]|uniref:DNA-directed DNA polymerase n=1 Tax=Bifidobacterium jacchi TaxID=2490545 RepID=A0A5N5RN42_9BIFI|nr:DNA polymerase III subunit delta [Bifidobacterium jacchi]KAB5608708.1 DNA polymerase III subunit delta [Bifidobacterium jacchi]
MATRARAGAPVRIVFGGDPYLNDQMVRDLKHAALKANPDADLVELDAATADRYAFDEAVSPSLLSDRSVVVVTGLQNADDALGESIAAYCRQTAGSSGHDASIVICQHDGGVKGKRIVEALVKAGAARDEVPDLKYPEKKLNFVLGRFERNGRRVEPMAAQQLVAVLGERTGELAAMCDQLCFDFDDDPIGLDRVNQYLSSNPQVSGFAVADTAMAGRGADAIIQMRAAVEQGVEPIAMIGALALKLRTVAKVAAVESGALSVAEAKLSKWALRMTRQQLPGWSSQGLATCIRMLAWADEQSKTSGGDPLYALERCLTAISAKGRL